MYELLLQADKALADGALDQAEQTYWQLIELDPSNGIAVAGLARIAQERGDERLALTFANRALAIDPENVAARRVVEALEHRGAEQVVVDLPDLPLVAAERLEALSRRRSTASHAPDEDAAPSAGEAEGGSKRTASEGRGEVAGEPAGGPGPPARHAGAADAGAAHPEAGPARGPRPGLRPDQVPELPSEPLTDRRQAGRLSAPAAAAAAAAMPQAAHRTATRHEPHHAMPSGKRRFQADELRAPTQDAYSAAEGAAAAEAVDALDVAEESPEEAAEAAETEAADESVALRIALVADAIELEAAQLEATRVLDDEERRAVEVAEADAAEPAPVGSIDDGLRVAESGASGFEAELRAAEAEFRAGPPRVDEFEVAEAEAARLAPKETLEALSAGPPEPVEQEARPRPSLVGGADELSEKEAEIQALREALAIVLESEDRAGPAESEGAAAGAPPEAPPAERSDVSAAQGETAEATHAPGQTRPGEPTQPTPQTELEPASHQKKGFLHRFRGS